MAVKIIDKRSLFSKTMKISNIIFTEISVNYHFEKHKINLLYAKSPSLTLNLLNFFNGIMHFLFLELPIIVF